MNHFILKIKEGYRSWNNFRYYYKGEIHLTGTVITDIDFTGCNLNSVRFTDSQIINCKFFNCDLSNVKFDGCTIDSCEFSKKGVVKRAHDNLKIPHLPEPLYKAANLTFADFSNSTISNSTFNGCMLSEANFSNSTITNCGFYLAFCYKANFYSTEFKYCYLDYSDLTESIFIETIFLKCNLSGSRIYGVSVWDIEIDELTLQNNLLINSKDDSVITVDNIEIGHFIYLLLNNKKIRDIIDTLTCKLVLILGRFTEERKPVLSFIKDKLRNMNYVPILFDFDKPRNRNFVETITCLAHLSKFIIADFTDSKIILEEVPHIVRTINIPVRPIILKGQKIPVTVSNLYGFPWFLDLYEYSSIEDIRNNFDSLLP